MRRLTHKVGQLKSSAEQAGSVLSDASCEVGQFRHCISGGRVVDRNSDEGADRLERIDHISSLTTPLVIARDLPDLPIYVSPKKYCEHYQED